MTVYASVTASGNGLPGLDRVPIWLNDPENWWGESGLIARVREHVTYSLLAVLIAAAIALPLGLLVGHTGRGAGLVGGVVNGLRAVPTLGIVVLLVVWISPHIHTVSAVPGLIPRGGLPYLIPVEITLVLLAIPPVLANAQAGVQAVEPAVRDAAEGMGFRGSQVLWSVEIPIAMPLILSGLRSATLQVISTATVAAYVPFLGGLGRLIIDGDQQLYDPRYGYPAMVSAGLVVAAVAVTTDALWHLIQHFAVSRGVSERFVSRRSEGSASPSRRDPAPTLSTH
jgi:osmoprotectant transport system permease protein